jgi:hypothetical protein
MPDDRSSEAMMLVPEYGRFDSMRIDCPHMLFALFVFAIGTARI